MGESELDAAERAERQAVEAYLAAPALVAPSRRGQKRPRGSADAWMAQRRALARRDGYRCHYCTVPTAATLDHKHVWIEGGENTLANSLLACPLCNSMRGDEDYASFVDRRGWRLPKPDLPDADVASMVKRCFVAQQRGRYVWSGSTNARIFLEKDTSGTLQAQLQVRAGKKYEWHCESIGPAARPLTVYGAYVFLRRHVTKVAKV